MRDIYAKYVMHTYESVNESASGFRTSRMYAALRTSGENS